MTRHPSRFDRFLPYTGVLAGLLFLVTMVGAYPEEYGDPNATKIINDHAVENVVAAVAMALCCVALLFFAAAIRRFVEREHAVVHWTEFDTGGHFAAMEVPDLLLGDIREFFRLAR